MLVLRVQNPQVLQADMASVAASNQPSPVSLKAKKETSVRMMYVQSIRLAKRSLRSPAKAFRATVEISAPDSVRLSDRTVSIENSVTMPTPPTQAVEMRQNWRPRGSASMSLRMDAPVVVNPETLSKRALTGVNSPP